jgi:hypothetical protein
MTASVSQDGVLSITPETEIECYALKKWVENYTQGTSESILAIVVEDAKHNPPCAYPNG